MPTIKELNEVWPAHLTDLHAQLWHNLQAQGVSAFWEDPLGGHIVIFPEEIHGVSQTMEQHEHYHFIVERHGKRLADHRLGRIPFKNIVSSALVAAGHRLEWQGIDVTSH